MSARINTRFPVFPIGDTTRLVCCLGYPTAEVGEGVTVEDRHVGEKHPGLVIVHVVAGKARETWPEYLDAVGAADLDQFYDMLSRYYRTGISGRVPITFYEVLPATEADETPWFHADAPDLP